MLMRPPHNLHLPSDRELPYVDRSMWQINVRWHGKLFKYIYLCLQEKLSWIMKASNSKDRKENQNRAQNANSIPAQILTYIHCNFLIQFCAWWLPCTPVSHTMLPIEYWMRTPFVKTFSLSPIVGIPWLFSNKLCQCGNCLHAKNPIRNSKAFLYSRNQWRYFSCSARLASSAQVWGSGDELMYEIPVINGHAAWNDKGLIPAHCALSLQSWGLEFNQGFVCGSTDCKQTMNPLIELQTLQSLRV